MRDQWSTKPRRLRELIAKRTVVLPGAFNALSAMQIERAGFDAVYVSGAALAAVKAYRTFGVIHDRGRLGSHNRLRMRFSIPALADADTGFGPSLSVIRTVRELEVQDCRELAGRSGHAYPKCRTSAGKAAGLASRDGRQDQGGCRSQVRTRISSFCARTERGQLKESPPP